MEQSKLDELNDLGVEESEKEAEVTIEEALKKERKIFFETKTMAEVYAEQGHTMIALEIYKRILQKNPSDLKVQQRISELETRLSSRREKFKRPHGDPSGRAIRYEKWNKKIAKIFRKRKLRSSFGHLLA